MQGAKGKRAFSERMEKFEAGRWQLLVDEAASECSSKHRIARTRGRDEQEEENLLEEVLRKVHEGELSRARQMLDSPG